MESSMNKHNLKEKRAADDESIKLIDAPKGAVHHI